MSLKNKLFLAAACATLVALVLFLRVSYHDFTAFVLRSINKDFPQEFVTNYFSRKSFFIVKTAVSAFIVLMLLLVFSFNKRISDTIGAFRRSIPAGVHSIKRCVRGDLLHTRGFKYFFLFIPLFIFLLQAHEATNRPFQYDEAWSYNYHIGNNFLSSFILPNNHIFYTVIAYIFNFLPFSHEFAVRLPLLLAGLAAFVLMYYFLRKITGSFSAWIGSVFFYTSCAVTFYTLYARAFMFELLFAIVFLIASYKWIADNLNNRPAFIWIFISFVLGVYSVPTSIYFFFPSFLVVSIFVIRHNKKRLIDIISGILLSTFLLSFLFLPVLFSAHLNDLFTQGRSSAPTPLSFIISYLYYNEDFHFGTERLHGSLYLFIVGFFLVLLSLFEGPKRYVIIVSLVGLLTSLLFVMVQKVMLAERKMIHLVLYFSIFAALFFDVLKTNGKLKLQFSTKIFFTLIITFFVSFVNLRTARNHHWYTWSISEDTSIKECSLLMQKTGIDSVFLFFPYSKPGVEYYYKIKNKKISIHMADSASLDFTAYDPWRDYEALMLKTNRPIATPPDRYDTIFSDKNYILLKRRD